MPQQLSLSARPRTLDQLVGQAKLVAAIRGHAGSERLPKAWLFHGPKGVGKTTVARILSLSYQCTHQNGIFGVPCKECRQNRSNFMIYEINAAKLTGKDDIQNVLAGSELGTLGDGKYRVYILDEPHMLSLSAQNMLLGELENTPETTIFIFCTTAPQRIIETLRSRCIAYGLRELEPDDVLLLTTRLLKIAKSSLPADRLADALIEHQVRSPRLIAQAVEKYIAGGDVEEASQVEGSTSIDVKVLTRATVKGDWPAVAQALTSIQGSDIRSVRLSLIAYLRAILLEEPTIGLRAEAVQKALEILCSVQYSEDSVVSAAIAAELYRCTAIFSKFKH